ncbi:hypothetical protein ACHMWN_15990 [Pedobacter sp. UC225_61]|uniref:hypothetical protein n=1 Tax=Pedobacter sp. UC225_61 TaxID=3374623 RepID=UPI0037BC769E
MNISRKLAEGVAGWLFYEFHSRRYELFSEKYLTAPIGNILHGQFDRKVIAEYNHPILTAAKKTPGRPPQLDFVIVDKGLITVAVESKWIGQTSVSVADIIWDMIRLELISNQTGAKCYFILGGQKKKLNSLFEHARFLEKTPDGRTRPVLRLLKGVKKASLRLGSPIESRGEIIKPRMQQYSNVYMPSVVGSNYPEYYPKECRNADFQVYVWEILSLKNNRFKPVNNKHYK